MIREMKKTEKGVDVSTSAAYFTRIYLCNS